MKKLILLLMLIPCLTFGQIKAYWKLNSDTIDYSGNGYTLTGKGYTGIPTFQAGSFNNGVLTNRSPGKYLYNSSLSQSTGPVTISAWVKPLEYVTGSQTEQAIVDLCSGAVETQDCIMLRYSSSAKICYYHGKRGVASTYIYNAGYTTGKWYYVVITYSGTVTGKMKLYVNGDSITSATNAGNGTTSPLYGIIVGAHYTDNSVPSTAVIDEVMVDLSVWSPAKVKTMYAAYKGLYQ